MVAFDFTVNPSFVSYGSHPITVPKSQVNYERLEQEHMGHEITVIEPSGSRMAGWLSRGVAGYGEYNQIRVRPAVRDPLCRLPIGTGLRVEMSRHTFRWRGTPAQGDRRGSTLAAGHR
jgi:hypothetical protein